MRWENGSMRAVVTPTTDDFVVPSPHLAEVVRKAEMGVKG